MPKKTYAEQIADLQATRAEKSARLEEITEKTMDEGRTKDAAEREEFNTLTDEIKALDDEIRDLRKMEKLNAEKAAAVPGAPTAPGVETVRAPAVVKSVKNDEPGIGFARFAMSMWAGKGNISAAKAFAEAKFGSDIRLNAVMKAAVDAGTTTNPTWAGSLVDYQNLSSEFVDFLRPATLVGQFGTGNIPSLRRVPFNVRIPGKTTKGTARWVGEGARKPLTSSGYAAQEFKWAKIAGISVITDELDRFGDPSVQMLVRDDLKDAIVEVMDVDFVDPTKAAGTGDYASPASVTNGVTAIPATADPKADINALWATADNASLPVSSAVYITNTAVARSLAGRENAVGGREFPNVTVTGGSIDGVPLLVSNHVPAGMFILAFASEIYLADDGIATIDISREATLVMDSDPNNASLVLTVDMLSNMFQENKLAIRAERYVNWSKRRPQAVAFLSGATGW